MVWDEPMMKAWLFIFMEPLCWNIIARLEYHTHFLTKACGGNKYVACYLLAACIFVASNLRFNQYP